MTSIVRMLYIFRVDTGAMVTLDMGLALETVAHLKVAVETNCGIPQEKQVLLISGASPLIGPLSIHVI